MPDKAEKASDAVTGLIPMIVAHPFAFLGVVAAIAFLLCFLPNGVFTNLIQSRTEGKKIDARVGMSRKKLSSGRQNRNSK